MDYEQLMAELGEMEAATLIEFKRALLAMQNMDDAAMLTITIGKQQYELPLVITELYHGFVEYLQNSVDCLEATD